MKSVTCKRSGALIVELFTVWFPTNPARGNSDVALGSRDQVYLAVIFLMRWHMLPRARIVRGVRGMLSSLVNFLPNYGGSVIGWDPEPLWHILPWLPTVCASSNLLKKTHTSSKQAVEPEEKSGVLLWLLHLVVTSCQWGNEQVKFWGYTLVCRGVPCFGSRVPHSWVATNMKYQDTMLPLITATESETDIKSCWWSRWSHHNRARRMDLCDSRLSLSMFLMSSETRSSAEE